MNDLTKLVRVYTNLKPNHAIVLEAYKFKKVHYVDKDNDKDNGQSNRYSHTHSFKSMSVKSFLKFVNTNPSFTYQTFQKH